MERQRMIEVDVFMLTWNLKDYTMRAVDTLLNVTEHPFHLYINDNGSVDGTREYLEETAKKDKRVTLILHDKPETSVCQALNECLRASRSPYVCVAQNDENFVSGKWLGELVKTLEKDPKIGMVGAKLLYPNGTIQHAGALFDKNLNWYHLGHFEPMSSHNEEQEVQGVTSALVLLRREAIPAGEWNEEYIGSCLFNDAEMSCLMRKNGWKIYYCPASVAIHYESATSRLDQAKNSFQFAYCFLIFQKNCLRWLIEDARVHGIEITKKTKSRLLLRISFAYENLGKKGTADIYLYYALRLDFSVSNILYLIRHFVRRHNKIYSCARPVYTKIRIGKTTLRSFLSGGSYP